MNCKSFALDCFSEMCSNKGLCVKLLLKLVLGQTDLTMTQVGNNKDVEGLGVRSCSCHCSILWTQRGPLSYFPISPVSFSMYHLKLV